MEIDVGALVPDIKEKITLKGHFTVSHSTSVEAFNEILEERSISPPLYSFSATSRKSLLIGENCPYVFLNLLPYPYLSAWGDVHLFISSEFIRANASNIFFHFDGLSF